MNNVCTLIDADTSMANADYLIEAIFMAASALGDRDATDAIQAVAEQAKAKVAEARKIIEILRAEAKQ